MNKITHYFFGIIDVERGVDNNFDDDVIVIWEDNYKGILTTLWYDKSYNLTLSILDTFSKFLIDFEKYKNNALIALENYLKENNDYIIFHKEELEINVPTNIHSFIENIKIDSISLWLGENFISIDFMIDPDLSDEILCIKYNSCLEIENISWES